MVNIKPEVIKIHNRYMKQLLNEEDVQETVWILEKYMRALRQLQLRRAVMEQGSQDVYRIMLPEANITVSDSIFIIRFGTLLPMKTKTECNLLCDELSQGINCFTQEIELDTPVFQKAVVIFRHHYTCVGKSRRLRDYDNLERKGVLDTLVPLMLPDDNPRCVRTMDMMVEDSRDFTELLLMNWERFIVFTAAPGNRF